MRIAIAIVIVNLALYVLPCFCRFWICSDEEMNEWNVSIICLNDFTITLLLGRNDFNTDSLQFVFVTYFNDWLLKSSMFRD